MERKNWNIENISHFPLLWYRYNYTQKAYDILTTITSMHRFEYPEVSYGMIEGIVSGAMGIVPEASRKRVTTLPKIIGEHYLQIDNLPLLGGLISVRHDGNKATRFTNNTTDTLTWEAAYMGKVDELTVNGKKQKTKSRTDLMGNIISYIEVSVTPKMEVKVNIE